MNTETNSTETPETLRADYIKALGLDYSAKFVPQSQSRNKGEKNRSLNWVITISKGRYQLVTDYSQGIAHAPGYKQLYGRVCLDDHNEQETIQTNAAEKGLTTRQGFSSLGGYAGKPLAPPSIEEVLYCLLTDSDAIDYPTFEEWASEFGYDADSRKGEAIYRQCVEIGLKLRAMIGDKALSELRDLYQDY